MKKLLLILLDSLAADGGRVGLDRERFRELALAAGYPAAEVLEVLDWLESRGEASLPTWGPGALDQGTASSTAVRCYAGPESEALEPEAFGYLLRLVAADQLSRAQMEHLLNNAGLIASAPLGRGDLDILLEQVVFGPVTPSTGLPGEPGHPTLH
jgi:uncharacterized protein Smg (DUF494 family)